MVVDKIILDMLTVKAKASPRLRMNLDLRNSAEDGSQRMLNALEPGTVLPIHRHHDSSETVVIVRGKIQWVFYDENGNETERVVLDADGDPRMLNVEKDRWHSLVALRAVPCFTIVRMDRIIRWRRMRSLLSEMRKVFI